ncbi:MAG: McrB family protein [Phocaeicola sp.]
METNNNKELYSNFLAITYPNSKSNYSDFKRILEYLEIEDIYSITDPSIISKWIEEVKEQEFNKKGKNQYSGALAKYKAFLELKDFFKVSPINSPIKYNLSTDDTDKLMQYLTAIRTKPFLLLAGISGTGKSRIVRELAFKSCPTYLQDNDKTTPGNYCMIEVKPNWHDSTELLGYYSNLSGGYQFKKFVQFLVKAKMYPEVPFFVCLDEMNLAPVEQYFAEVLSVLETRKSVNTIDGRAIKTGVIIEAQHFEQLGKLTGSDYNQHFTDREIYMKLCSLDKTEGIKSEVGNKKELTTEGLTLPHNVIIIGTVNMDDTTHQFSRKVIDRAMTIEMNGGNLRDMFGGSKDLEYLDDEKQQEWQRAFRQNYVTADEVLEAHPTDEVQIVELLPTKLEEINKALKGTPFEVSYRVLNELTIMVGVMLDKQKEGEAFEEIVNRAIDAILLMKILPRIEGDSEMFNLKNSVMVNGVACNNRLEWLRELAPSFNQEEDAAHQQTAKEKIEEMIERLENQEFTRFWP